MLMLNDSVEKKRKPITIELKKEIVEKLERGVRVVDRERHYSRSMLTVCTILKKKDEIKAITTAKCVSRPSLSNAHLRERMGKLHLLWIKEQQRLRRQSSREKHER